VKLFSDRGSTPLGSTKIKRQFSTENCRFILGFGLTWQASHHFVL